MPKRNVQLKDYALYKGDEFIDLGNIHELSQRQEISIILLNNFIIKQSK